MNHSMLRAACAESFSTQVKRFTVFTGLKIHIAKKLDGTHQNLTHRFGSYPSLRNGTAFALRLSQMQNEIRESLL